MGGNGVFQRQGVQAEFGAQAGDAAGVRRVEFDPDEPPGLADVLTDVVEGKGTGIPVPEEQAVYGGLPAVWRPDSNSRTLQESGGATDKGYTSGPQKRVRRRYGNPGETTLRSLIFLCALLASALAHAAAPYAFGVLNHRSLSATAAYWNPILVYVSAKSGVPLELHIGRTASETTDLVTAGKLDFAYTNHLFSPKRAALGWRVLARQDTGGIRGQIVVPADSPAKSLRDLEGKAVVFANPYGFTGYYVPYDALLRANVNITPLFAGNQEAAMGRLRSGHVAAAGVNHQVMADFSRKHDFEYRVLSESEPYFDLAVMASPRVSPADGEKVRQALVGMMNDPEGLRVLRLVAQGAGLDKPRGFVAADVGDYANYRAFFSHTRVPVNE